MLDIRWSNRSSRWWRAGVLVVGVVLVGLSGLGGPFMAVAFADGHRPELPVTYSYPHSLAAGGVDPNGSPPGANDWSCKPSSVHPRPVVLVHGGFLNMREEFDTVSPLLFNNGFCVFATNYGQALGSPYAGGQRPIAESAQAFGEFVDRVLASTGADTVDLVGHSEGTVMPRYWMNFLGGAHKVTTYVMVAPIWKGSRTYGAADLLNLTNSAAPGLYSGLLSVTSQTAGAPAIEYEEGSPFMTRLNNAGMALPGVTYMNIASRYDELVTPYTNGFTQGERVTNVTAQDHCSSDLSEHATLIVDPVVMQYMLNALDPEHALAVPCATVAPLVGLVGPAPHVGLRD